MMRRPCLLYPMVCVLTLAGGTLADESAEVTVNYILAPTRPLPDGLRAVAVIDAGVQTRGAKQDARERKWSTMAADMIESLLANSSARFGSGLQVAQRRHTRQILAEKDLQLAGLVDGPTAERAGKLLAVQGLIASEITVEIDVQKTRKSTVDWAQLLGMAAEVMLNGGREPAPVPPAVVVQPQPAPAPPPPAPAYARPTYLRQNRPGADPRDPRASPAYRPDPDPRSRDPRTLRYRRYAYDRRYEARPGVIGPPGAVVVRPVPTGVLAPVPAPAPAPVAVPAPAAEPPSAGGELGGLGMKEVEEVSRHLTVHCSFALIDAVTGQTIVMYRPPPYRKVDKASPDFLYGSMHAAPLDPVDHFIGELVEQGVQEFVSLLVPTEVEYRYELVARHSRSEAGIRALRGDDFEAAAGHFEADARKYDDEPEPFFALGVLSEIRGEPRRALDYYRRAASMDDVPPDQLQVYLAAKNRLSEHLPRIWKAPPSGFVSPEAVAGPSRAGGQSGSPPARGFGFGSSNAHSPDPPARSPSAPSSARTPTRQR